MPFVDEAKFYVKAGDGGNGCLSFRREKFVPKGGPDGGDGGDGGSVIIEASSRLHSLLDFKTRSHFKAKNGAGGKGKKMHGRNGEDFVLYVPCGSLIKDANTNEVLVDLVHDGQRFVAVQGGKGGRGNVHFASAQNRAPRIATKGKPGEERWFKIELKLLADVGLIGLPNAGKSTLLSKLSAANPKVAPYPFTTLEPQLGVLQFEILRPCIIADIPGLIEGAHQGVGLGHKFLRHIERTRVLLHLIDVSESTEIFSQYHVIVNELMQYNDELTRRRQLVLFNKIDMVDDPEELRNLQESFEQEGIETMAISALTGEGLGRLKKRIAELLAEIDGIDDEAAQTDEESV